MRNDLANSATPVPGVCVKLRQMWQVEMVTQDIRYAGGSPWADLVLIRTVSGAGELHYRDGARLALPAESLVVADGPAMCRHRVAGTHWNYWFVDFIPVHLPEFRHNTVMQVPSRPREDEQLLSVLNALRNREPLRQCLGAAIFGTLLSQWLVYWQTAAHTGPEHRSVERIIALMHERLRDNWTVAAMASQAGVSLQHLRRQFLKVTGRNPKAHYDALRLGYARQLLALGGQNVREVAQDLGYSSAFHFSRAYRQRFGHPPRTARPHSRPR